MLIAEFYSLHFTMTDHSVYSGRKVTNATALYDFLYERGWDAWFCNTVRKRGSGSNPRTIKDFIMSLHTGQSLVDATPDWTWKQRERLGQRYLEELAEDAVQRWDKAESYYRKGLDSMKKALELDGYGFKDGRLLVPEQDVVDAQEQAGVLRTLFQDMALGEEAETFSFLEASDDHYIDGKWADAIHNARKFLESTLWCVATKNASETEGRQLPVAMSESPASVRDYLEKQGLLEEKEKKALSAVYSLLSHTGGHPYMAEKDQARLLRHLAITFCHFVMLRLKGRLAAAG